MGLAEAARGTVEIFVGDPAGHIRSNVCSALRQEGFAQVREYSRLPELRADIATSYVDLLVLDLKLPGGEVCAFVEEIRRTDISANPFVAIIATTWDARTEMVRRVAETGVDDILVKPISVARLLQRIEAIATDRKPFAVTSDYIGPDRRSLRRARADSRLIAVPNTLNAKSKGRPLDIANLRQAIDQTQARVNAQKLEQNAQEIVRLIGVILPTLGAAPVDEAVKGPLATAHALSKDTAARLRGTPFEGVADMCAALVNVISSLLEANAAPNPKDVELLQPLSQGLLVAVASDGEAREKTGEIAASVESFTQSRKRTA